MKTIIIALFALFTTSTSFAQITPGSYVVGGGFGLGFSQTPLGNSNRTSASFSISPSIGKFTSEKYLIGGGIGFNLFYQNMENPGANYTRMSAYRMTGQFDITRFIPIMDRLYFTVGGAIIPGFSLTNSETLSNGNTFTSNSSSASATLSIAPGLTYFINRKWMVNASVGLMNYELDYNLDTDEIGHSFGLSARSNGFQIGVSYVLGKGTNE